MWQKQTIVMSLLISTKKAHSRQPMKVERVLSVYANQGHACAPRKPCAHAMGRETYSRALSAGQQG